MLIMQSLKIKSSLALALVSVLLMSSINVAVAKNDATHKANPSAYDRDKDGVPDSRDNDDNDGTPDSRDADSNDKDNDAGSNDSDGHEGSDSDGKDGDD